jgi:glycosyltransferase involved in cell wall biosynthesis
MNCWSSMPRLLIFVVAYNAEKTLTAVLRRLPPELFTQCNTSVLVIDDASADRTFETGEHFRNECPHLPITLWKNPTNLGYGGNQKLGYEYAIREGFDIVALLHGDGQYAPEKLTELLHPLLEKRCDAVFGSRMMPPQAALQGGMPLYKYLGNRILTSVQNRLTGLNLSEWHSGYRLYAVNALRKIPFERNSDDFDFDTDIILQLHMAGCSIEEVPIPTFYGNEICHVNGVKYAYQIVRSTICAWLQQFGILHDPKFDVTTALSPYQPKFHFSSSHQMALDSVQPGEKLLVLGCGPPETVAPLVTRAGQAVLVDLKISDAHHQLAEKAIEMDLEDLRSEDIGTERFDCVLLLDVIEHLSHPEEFLTRLRSWKQLHTARFVLTTPNVAFLPIRILLALGQFNYGLRGILDKTHTRLFTFSSFRRLLRQENYRTLQIQGIPAPFPLAVGDNWIGRGLLTLNSWALAMFPRIFAYQIYCEAMARPTVDMLLEDAERHSAQLREKVL